MQATRTSSRSRRLLVALAVVLGLIATGCGGSEPVAAEPSLVASTINGEQIDFGSLEGQDVVLWFWAPW